MSDQKHLQTLLPKLNLIPLDELLRPTIPVYILVQEMDNLFEWAQQDRNALTGVGLNWDTVEDLPISASALRKAQSSWKEQRFQQKDAERNWASISEVGYEERDDILDYARYAYRNHPELLRQITDIAKGGSNANMIQDLSDLAILGQRHLDPLLAVNFDPARLDRAMQLSNTLGESYARAITDRAGNKEARVLRDRAYTFATQLMSEVSAAGQFAFRKQPDRQRGYFSDYRRQQRRNRNRNELEIEQPQQVASTERPTQPQDSIA